MFSKYLEQLRSRGKRAFTLQQAMMDLNATSASVSAAIYRLKKEGKIISPARGFYVMVPPEHRPLGCIPAEQLVPLLMRHLDRNYYVCFITAAKYYGAAHQKIAVFQIFVDQVIGKTLTFGQVKILCYYKKDIEDVPVRDFKMPTGYLKVSTPEVTAMDILYNYKRSGGLNNVATVLSELIESIDPDKLIELAVQTKKVAWLQRFGFILEQLDPMDEDAKDKISRAIESYLASKRLALIPLNPKLPITGRPRHRKWNIIENTTFESDI